MTTEEKIHIAAGFDSEKIKMIRELLIECRINALTDACNVVKTYKVGNSGSWYDAAVDKAPIIELIKQTPNWRLH